MASFKSVRNGGALDAAVSAMSSTSGGTYLAQREDPSDGNENKDLAPCAKSLFLLVGPE